MERKPKKIRILFTIPNFDTAGSGKALLNIAQRLDKKYFEPHIACLHDQGDFFKVVKESKIPVHIFTFTIPMKQRLNGLFQCWNISRQMREINPRIIHSFHYAPDYSEALAAKFAFIPWVFTKKNMSWGGQSRNGWKLRSALAKHIIIQNTDMKKEFYSTSSKTTLIHRGVNTKEFIPQKKNQKLLNKYSILEKEKIILTVANLIPVKGIEVLIEAFELLFNNHINIHLFIVGENNNEYGKLLKNMVCGLNSRKRIYFTGTVHNIFDYYSIADIFVLPTLNKGRKEGCPVALLEALSFGIPSIASNISGIRDILNDSPECFFQAGDINSLRCKLNSLLNNVETSRRDIKLQNYIRQKFDINREVQKHVMVYNKVLS